MEGTRGKRHKQQAMVAHRRQDGKITGYRLSLLLACSLQVVGMVGAQCPANTMTSFERISNVMVKDSLLTLLYAANLNAGNHSSTFVQTSTTGASGSAASMLDTARQLAASLSQVNSLGQPIMPITAECNNRCRRSAKCRAFLVNYERQTCYAIEHYSSSSSSSILQRAPTQISLVPTNERTSYFEKVCLSLPAVECERAWVYERVIGYQIQGQDDRIIEEVPTRLRCQELCLNERDFRCRSGEYDHIQMQCRLSMTDRHQKPSLFRPASASVDYFENQCVSVGNQCDAFDRYEDTDLGRPEIMRAANSSDQCQQLCTQTIKAFICRSFTWNPLAGKCYMNSANSFMVGGMDRLINAPGLVYYQRNDCVDLKLECDTTAMTLNLRTSEPFRGRMYVRDDPSGCETLGRSGLLSSLQIPFNQSPMGARCATREMPSRYSSVVVVQQHPLIQRKTDRYIKLVCDFQTSNKTISSAYSVVANTWTSTALINATLSAPKIRLRITDKYGVDITGAKLGDELHLRVEAESESVYDMMARSVLAKSGTTDESIELIDKQGCPADFRIFPPLRKLNRRTIVGKFDAFKFSSDVVVRFQVDVQFCLHQCPAVSCEHNLLLNSQPAELGAPGSGLASGSPESYSAASTLPTTAMPSSATLAGDSAPVLAALPNDLGAITTARPPLSSDGLGLVANEISASLGATSAPSTQHRVHNYSASFSQHAASPYGQELANSQQPSGYFVGQHVMRQPANQPAGLDQSAPNGLMDRDLDLPVDSMPQMSFESRQADARQVDAGQAEARQADARQADARPADARLAAARSAGSTSKVRPASQRRRRRAVEPPPVASADHVPLQREIIVETNTLDLSLRHGADKGRSVAARQDARSARAGAQRTNRQLPGKSMSVVVGEEEEQSRKMAEESSGLHCAPLWHGRHLLLA